MSESEQVGVVAEKAPRRAPNKIPEEQDDFLMSLARREVKASEAVASFLDRFPPSTTCDPSEAAQRTLFLYRHRLRRARAEKGPQTPVVVLPSVSNDEAARLKSSAPVVADTRSDVAANCGVPVEWVPEDHATMTDEEIVEAVEANMHGASLKVGDRVCVVRGHAALNCTGVVKDLLPFAEHTHSVGVDFGEGVGLWFPPSHLQVVTGGLDGVVSRVEQERDAEVKHAADLTAALAATREELEVVKRERDEATAKMKLDPRATTWEAATKELGERLGWRYDFAGSLDKRAIFEEMCDNVVKEVSKSRSVPRADQQDNEIRRIALEALRESAAAARAVSDAVQALASQQADALAAKDAEIASLRLHLDDLRRSGGLR